MKKLTALILSFVLVFTLTACGGPTPTETVTTFFKALQNGGETSEVYEDKDFKFGSDMLEDELGDDGEKYTEKEKETIKKFEEKIKDFDFEVSNEKIDGDKATVDVKITTWNFGEQFSNMMTELIEKVFALALTDASEEEINEMMEKMLGEYLEKTEKTYTKTVKVPLEKKDSKWVISKIDDESDIADALLGGMLKAAEEIDEAMDD